MRKEIVFVYSWVGITVLLFAGYSEVYAADTVVVVPLFTTAICTAPDEVKSAGYCWKDRNLGAIRVATKSDDSDAYGDLYQWGRLRDGHQHRDSVTTFDNSPGDVPGHGNFIKEGSPPYDWRIPQNANLWQGLGGVNNPCPQGFRLPTETELIAERTTWTSGNNTLDAFASPLKLVVAGSRNNNTGDLENIHGFGQYWSSTVSGSESQYLYFHTTDANINNGYRALGMSVRCIKD
jgi:uncharacterized protein (TIGR02145 family)